MVIAEIDLGYEKFNRIIQEVEGYKETIETEQDTRLKILNRIITEVLGWNLADISTEPPLENGYIDYLMTSDDTSRLVVEAKKISRDLGLQGFKGGNAYKIKGPVFKTAECQEGIKQTCRYCQAKGVQLACLTSGFQWLIFLANRVDGRMVEEGFGYVFSSLNEIKDNFKTFWNLLSKEAIFEKKYVAIFNEQEGISVRHRLFYKTIFDAHRSRHITRSNLSQDLEPVFTNFFTNITGDENKELLEKCFVETAASREADLQLQAVAESLIENIKQLHTDSGQELQQTIEDAIKSARKEFILIVGPKGAGKSTFVDRFFKYVLRSDLAKKCFVIKVDLKNCDGNINAINEWLNETLLQEIEKNLFKDGIPQWNQLQGIFKQEYDRWKQGEHKPLYESNPTEFNQQFGHYLFNLRQTDKSLYIQRILRDIVYNRLLLPCLMFDNIDHFGIALQQTVFQHARALFEKCDYLLVILPTTDRTIWQLSKQGPMQSYFSKCFSLPVPSPKAVISKRIEFIRNKLVSNTDKKIPGGSDYFLNKGIRVSIKDLNAFATCLEEVFIKTDYVSTWIGKLANYDIRRCLELSHRIICSPYIPIDDLIKAFLGRRKIEISEVLILKAIILGRYEEYMTDDNNYVRNLFLIDREPPCSPLINLRILQLLKDVLSSSKASRDQHQVYMDIDKLLVYFEGMGVYTEALVKSLNQLLKSGLVESFDPTKIDVSNAHQIRITPSGELHLEWALSNFVYLFIMAKVSPIADEAIHKELKTIFEEKKSTWGKICGIFTSHLVSQDTMLCKVVDHESYAGEKVLTKYLGENWRQSLKAYSIKKYGKK